MTQSMLTTIDNPFDPFTQFDEWYAFDESKGYHTCSLLSRITKASEELDMIDQQSAIERAIEEIVKYNVSGIHRKVTKED